MEIRPAVVDDAEAAAALVELMEPYLVTSAGGLRSDLGEVADSRARAWFAAVENGELVGWSSSALIAGSDPVGGVMRVLVNPRYAGRGAGTGLVEVTHEHLKNAGAKSVRVFADPASVRWASRWGYAQTRQVHYAGIEPRMAPALPEIPPGVRLVPLHEADPRAVYAADEVAQRTKPGDAKITSRPYDDWLAGVWNSSGMVLDLSVAALAGDRVVGFTLGSGDHHKIWSQMTATMPEYRGRGLAKLVKCAALHRAAEAGVVGAFTANYDGNEPMLAVNNWLGYRRAATHSVIVCPL
jgi:GNAT superfamily N-acetyltransferase